MPLDRVQMLKRQVFVDHKVDVVGVVFNHVPLEQHAQLVPQVRATNPRATARVAGCRAPPRSCLFALVGQNAKPGRTLPGVARCGGMRVHLCPDPWPQLRAKLQKEGLTFAGAIPTDPILSSQRCVCAP